MNDDGFEFEDEYEDDDLDLLKLVSTNANDLNQYLIFKGSDDEWYGLNVSKIEEIMVYDDSLDIVKNKDKESVVFATADIRKSMTTLIYFDDWFGSKRLDDSEYELIILTNYGGHKLGIIVKEVAHISTIEADGMSINSQNNAKTTFITKITVKSEQHMCTIYDGDKMLLDVFDNIQEQSNHIIDNEIISSLENKVVLYADDSKFIRSLVEKLFNKLKLNYKIFTDGLLLVNYIKTNPQTKVDLFITDLEMPSMGGKDVILNIRENTFYNNTPILVHTNMSSSVIEEELLEIGASEVIGKVNMLELSASILKEINR